MIWIVTLPIGALMLGILVVRAIRRFRELAELQARRAIEGTLSEAARPSDVFHSQVWLPLCERVAAAAAGKLKRPLTSAERQIIWRARSQLVLEVALREIASASDAGQVQQLLSTLPSGMNRPDPTHWCLPEAERLS